MQSGIRRVDGCLHEIINRTQRKASQERAHPGKPKRPKSHHQTDEPLRFMDLPAELRNVVYASIAKGRTALLGNGTLTGYSHLSQERLIHPHALPVRKSYQNKCSRLRLPPHCDLSQPPLSR